MLKSRSAFVRVFVVDLHNQLTVPGEVPPSSPGQLNVFIPGHAAADLLAEVEELEAALGRTCQRWQVEEGCGGAAWALRGP